MSFFSLSAKDIQGQEFSMKQLEGKVVLVVNVASGCGLTPQYQGLESLYRRYKDQGLVILGFPCNQFGAQEPGSEDQIVQFCSTNYQVSFPMMKKIDVNGDGTHPVFVYLKSEAPGLLGSEMIKWNFTKFLVGRDGKVLERFAPTTAPEDLVKPIEKALAL
jgi:glutathione peroxidase